MKDLLPLVARGLSRVFKGWLGRRSVLALDRFDAQVGAGEILGLVGPNGSGKTTAIRCCLGLLSATAGEARLFGATAGAAAARTGVGYAPERFDLAGKRSGRETLALLGSLAGLRGGDLEARVDSGLERLELAGAARQPLRAYSKGMVRRLSVAAALLHDPKLLILDEPFDGLDPLGCQVVREELQRRASEGAAVVVSSHALADLEAVATHLMVLSGGKTLLSGAQSEVLTVEDRTEIVVDGLSVDDLEALRRVVEGQGGTVHSTSPARESLEELFRRHISGRQS